MTNVDMTVVAATERHQKASEAINQWRDSVVSTDGTNRFVNFKPRKASTVEFTKHTAAEVYRIIASRKPTYTMGITPSNRPTHQIKTTSASFDEMDLAQQLIDELDAFDPGQFPDHLFSTKTQVEVDRALKNLAKTKRDHFIDHGRHTLYVGFGELIWKDLTKGDDRRSPLLMVPVELLTDGPGQRYYLSFTDGDIRPNPVLKMKLATDFNITIPSPDELLELVESSEQDAVTSMLAAFRAIEWPEGWEVKDTAVLDTFTFTNESVYHDLKSNRDVIVKSKVIQSLAGVMENGDSPFAFETHSHKTIDTVAEPEITPLVLDADSSQRAAIQAAVEGRSFILDGPPGTGKSQTIANIIGALIEKGKSVLFVSEKAVALDVVRDRLATKGLDPFVFELHSKSANRKEVAVRLGQALNYKPQPPAGMSPDKLNRLREIRLGLTNYVTAANEVREPIGLSFFQVLGRLEGLGSTVYGPAMVKNTATLSAAQLADLEGLTQRVQEYWPTLMKGKDTLWYGLVKEEDNRYLLQQLKSVLAEIQMLFNDTSVIRESFGLNTGTDLVVAAQLLDQWHQRPEFHDQPWLDITDIPTLVKAVGRYVHTTTAVEQAFGLVTQLLGNQWQAAKVIPTPQIPTFESPVFTLPGLEAHTGAKAVLALRDQVRAALNHLEVLDGRTRQLCSGLGAQPPATIADLTQLLEAVRILVSPDCPPAAWVSSPEAVTQAQTVAAHIQQTLATYAHAEQAATGKFTAQVLTVDLARIEQLAAQTGGFFKRFGNEYKELQDTLATISPLEPKEAIAALPTAKAWVAAHQQMQGVMQQAQQWFPGMVLPDGQMDWARIDRVIAGTAICQHAGLTNGQAIDMLNRQPEARQQLAAMGQTLQQGFDQWQTRFAQFVAQPVVSVVDAYQILTSQLGQLDDLAKVIQSAMFLGPDTPIATYLKAADARAGFAHALAQATQARHALAEVIPLDVHQQPSVSEATKINQQLEWLKGLHLTITHGRGVHRFTSDQIEALQESYPISGSTDLASQYTTLVNEFLTWFDPARQASLREDLSDYVVAGDLISAFEGDTGGAYAWFELKRTIAEVDAAGLEPAFNHAVTLKIDAGQVKPYLMATVYRTWLDAKINEDARFRVAHANSRDDLVQQFRTLDRELNNSAIGKIIEAGNARRPKSTGGQVQVIRKAAEKKRCYKPIRDLINESRDVILRLHPCFMMSPYSVSEYLPAEQMFDVVIFDEASQVKPGDAINCIYRGKALIAAGDQKQLPPTDFFSQQLGEEDGEGEEDLANDYESILDLMKSSGAFEQQTLNWHYRSRHEHLITFSNASFYESRLVTFPGALAESPDAGVKFIKVNGVYQRGRGGNNPIEAKHVAQRVIHHFETRPDKTLGVVTFSTAQQSTVEHAIELARKERPDLEKFFTEDRASGFFIKNLEQVQGDERDVIIFSVGYGPDEHGRVYNNFGPLNRAGGERRLNVAITRAKELVEVVSSMSASDIKVSESAGVRHFRRYLDYAERGPEALELELGESGRATESPFEDSVLDYVRSLGYDVQPQVGVAGYRIDLGVKHPDQPGAFMLGIECDGAAYHSSFAARDRDRIRHEILEGLGWQLHHIWGTDWYRDQKREKDRLRELLEAQAAKPVVGRVVKDEALELPEPTVSYVEEPVHIAPDWIVDYTVAKPDPIPETVDLSQEVNAARLKEFVSAVAQVEAPIHVDVMVKRLRDNSAYEMISSKTRNTLLKAVKMAGLKVKKEFIIIPDASVPLVRRNTDDCERTIIQIPDEEIQVCITGLLSDAIGMEEPELITSTAKAFGFKRTGPDIKKRLHQIILRMKKQGTIEENGIGLRLPELPESEDTE